MRANQVKRCSFLGHFLHFHPFVDLSSFAAAAAIVMVTTFFRLLSSPRLLWVHKVAPDGNFAVGQAYAPNFAEAWGQSICSWIRVIVELGLYSSPFWIAYYNRRLEYLVSNPRLLVDFAVGLSCMYFFGVVLRAAGRVSSPVYCEFEQALRAANQSWNPKTKA